MTRLIIITIAFLFSTTSCSFNGRQNFSLSIKHYAGGYGLTVIYELNENGLHIDTNCDLENCTQKTVYTRTFTKNESDSIYRFIKSLKLDTLRPAYETKGISDGLFTKIKFRRNLFSSHETTLDNFKTLTTDKLFRYIDNLISEKKYKFYSWGQS